MIRIAICDDDVKGAETAGRIVERCCEEKKMVCKSRIFYDSKALFYDFNEGAPAVAECKHAARMWSELKFEFDDGRQTIVAFP